MGLLLFGVLVICLPRVLDQSLCFQNLVTGVQVTWVLRALLGGILLVRVQEEHGRSNPRRERNRYGEEQHECGVKGYMSEHAP